MALAASVFAILALAGSQASSSGGTQDQELRELVKQIEGESVRNTDFSVTTEADRACDQLIKIGKPAVPFLIEELKSPKGWAKVHAMEVLAKLHAAEAIKPLLKILYDDPEMGVRGIAARNLGSFDDRSVVPDLLEAANSPDKDIHQGAWVSLGNLRETRAVPILVKNLDAKVPSIPSLILGSDYTPVAALIKIGDPAVPSLVEALKNTTGDAQQSAARALGGIGTDEAMTALQAAFRNPETRDAARAGYFNSSRPEAVAVGIAALNDLKYRHDAVSYFDSFPTPKCLPALKAAMAIAKKRHDDDDDYFLRLAADLIKKLDAKP